MMDRAIYYEVILTNAFPFEDSIALLQCPVIILVNFDQTNNFIINLN